MAQQNQSNWEADKMLDVYIYDYLMKKKLHNTAKSFMTEGKVSPDPVAIDAPGGFLFEWWSVFWDIFIARTNEKHSEAAAAYIEAQQTKAREQQQQQQQLQMQQLQLMRQAQLQRRDPAQPSLVGPTNVSNSEGMLGQPTASALATKIYEERFKLSNPVDSPGSQPLLDARVALQKFASGHPGQLVQGNSSSVTAALHQIQDIKPEVNMGGNPRSLPMNPSSIYGQNIMQPRPGVGNAGLSHGAGDLPLKGWPLTGIDQIRPSLSAQVQKPFLQSTNQYQLMQQQQQQQLLAQVQTQGNLSTSPIFGDMDPRVFRGLPRGALNTKEGQMVTNDGSVGSPMQSSSSKINVPQMQQSSSQQQQDPLQPQQMQQNNRKRKGLSSSGPANSTGTGNTIGPSPNSQPSTPSTHTPGDGVSMASNVQQASSMSKGLMMYGSNGLGGLTSSANQLDEIDHFGDVGSLDDNVESFLSPDDGDGRDVFAKLKQNSTDHVAETTKDGKYLASAGQEKKAPIKQGKSLISSKNSFIEE